MPDARQVRLEQLAGILSGYRFRYTDEKLLQDGIASVLEEHAIAFKREESLSIKDRPDFLLSDGLAIEVKIKGSLSDLLRQAFRYAKHDSVRSLLIVGTPHWLSRIPPDIEGKPVQSLRLIRSLL